MGRKPRNVVIGLGLLAVVGLLLASCGRSPIASAPASGVPAPAATSHGHGDSPFQLAGADGQTLVVPKAGMTTVLSFMSAACSSCVGGESEIRSILPALPPGVVLVTVDVTPGYDTPQDQRAFAKGTGASWPHAFATTALLQHDRVEHLDQVAVVDPKGRLVLDNLIPPPEELVSIIRRASRDGGSS
jgi:cytochrome oxidase Cu insertion factor (SCO1/SenC/PrrC family)